MLAETQIMKKAWYYLARQGIIAGGWLGLVLCSLLLFTPLTRAGWVPLTWPAPGNVGLMLLLPDGTVMAADTSLSGLNGNGLGMYWYRLAPDAGGHYVNGSWSMRQYSLATRMWFASQVLQNGKVVVVGGEYGTGGFSAELYDPVNDDWSTVDVPLGLIDTVTTQSVGNGGFRDPDSIILPNGKVMIAPVLPATNNNTVIYDPTSNTMSPGPAYLTNQNECSWVKLPDGSILTADDNNATSERYIPSLNQWIPDAPLPVPLFDVFGTEEGPGFLLPNGKVIFFGGNGKTLIYTPSGSTNPGSWIQGPVIPNDMAMADAGGCMMANGKILIAAALAPYSSTNIFNQPTYFFEYDYSSGPVGAFQAVTSPIPYSNSDIIPSYNALMLALPDGTVLYSDFSTHLFVYTPDSGPLPAGKPTIHKITPNADGSYHVTGTLFNGISQGAAYGDDAQMDSDFPLVKVTSNLGEVRYCRTFNWSGTTVMTGNQEVSTDFDWHNLFPGTFLLQVVANGNLSDPVFVTGPVWVDFNASDALQLGTYELPYTTLTNGMAHVNNGGTIFVKPGTTSTPINTSKPMEIRAIGGQVNIGSHKG